MKFIAMGDLHLTDKQPARRTDDYPNTLFDKLKYVTNHAIENEIELLVFAGDIFDSHKINIQTITKTIQILMEFDHTCTTDREHILVVLGQHDLAFRSEHNSPVKILEAVGLVRILYNRPFIIQNFKLPHTAFYGCSFNEKIPVPVLSHKVHQNILVIHKMISDHDYWSGNLEYSEAKVFLKEHADYQLVISGDNHNSFYEITEHQTLVNSGSLGRKNIDQIYHEPEFFVINTNNLHVIEHVKIPIKPYNEVFNLELMEKEKEKNENLDRFIDSLPAHVFTEGRSSSSKMQYSKKVLDYITTHKDLDFEVVKVLQQCLDNL